MGTELGTRIHNYSSGNGNRLKKITPSSPKGDLKGLGGHTFKNVGKMPNSWTDCEQIWHTYADPTACEWTLLAKKN